MAEPGTEATVAGGGKWAERFLVNVAWSWAGVLASFFTGFFLSPYIIRKLGDQRYGIWALAFAFIDYFVLFDFGFKSAIVNRVARYRACNEEDRINEAVSTALFYFLGIGALILALAWTISGQLYRFFQITPAYRSEFTMLVRIIAVGWAVAIALNVFQGGLEAFQRFKTQNHIYILSLILRSGGCALALYFGFGLTAMGLIVTLSQFTTNGLVFVSFRRAFPALRLSPALVRRAVWKDLAGYGVHAFVAYMGNMLLNQGPPVIVGHFRPEAFVGYYTLPSRLLQYMVELVTRIGFVTMPNTAELAARGRRRDIVHLGIYLNRYCLALFLPLSVFLVVYGRQLILVWVGPSFAAHAAPLLPAFVLATSLAVAGQFNSSQILFGLAKHETYAKGLVVEAAAALLAMTVVLPRYGILGAAWVAASLAILNRGMVTPYLLCRTLKHSLFQYLRGIYLLPVLVAVPLVPYAWWIQSHWWAGRNWIQLLGALGLIAAPYYALCFYTAVERDHRILLQTWIRKRVQAWRAAA